MRAQASTSRMVPNGGIPLPVIFTGIPHDWINHARKRCVEVIDELDIRDYIFPRKMPNGRDRVLSEVRASDLEAAAFSCQINQVWNAYKTTQTHITDMDLSPGDSVEMRQVAKLVSTRKAARIDANTA